MQASVFGIRDDSCQSVVKTVLTRPLMKSLLLTALLALATAAIAQQAAPRAVPVDDTPPRAVPVDPTTLTPTPAPRAQPVEDGADKPKGGPEQDLFDYAQLAYGQKDYVIAAEGYGKYLSTFPAGKYVAEALFRLGECYRNQNRLPDAERYYRQVVDKHAKTEFSANSAYWLGVMSFNANDYKAAATFFGFCEGKASVEKVKLAAAFYKSEAYGQLKDRKKQLAALEPVLAAKKENDFLEKALLSAATAYQTDGQNAKALPMLLELIDTSKDPAVQGDAALKAALIQSELKKPEEAAKLFDRVLGSRDIPQEQRGAALVGLIGELYSRKDYDGVVDVYNRNSTTLPPPELRARMLMHVGNAQRMKKSYQRAIDLYEMIRQYFPDHELAFEAAYWRLFCYYQLDDRRVGEMAEAFLQQYAGAHKDHEFISLARLLIADYHFTKLNYKLAADAYAALDMKKVPERFRGSTLFHKGWCEAEVGRHSDAILSLNGFIKDNPSDPETPKALAKRGLCLKETQNPNGALEDFARIIKEYPQSEAMELALYLSGMIHYEQRTWKPMIADFETLMKQFPRSAAVAEAAFKTGLGYIELKDVTKALPLFREAVRLDEKTFGNIATQKVLLCLWSQKDVEALSKEVDAYRGKYSDAVLVPRMLGYLGLTYFDKKDFHRAARYLTWAATPDAPDNTEPAIWNYLAQSQLETRTYDEALKAIENYLDVAPEGQAKAKGFHTKAKAQLGLGQYEDVIETANQGLHIVKDGGLQGQLLIVQGDALLAMGDKKEAEGNHDGAAKDWKDAASKYVVPSQVLDDATVTPEALYKAAQALERLHDKAAEDMTLQLKTKFPNFKPEEPPPPPPAPKKEPEPTPEPPKDKAPPKAEKVD